MGRCLRFHAVSAVALLVNLAVLSLLIEYAGLHYLAAEAIAIFVAFLTNYRGNIGWTYLDRPDLDVAEPAASAPRDAQPRTPLAARVRAAFSVRAWDEE